MIRNVEVMYKSREEEKERNFLKFPLLLYSCEIGNSAEKLFGKNSLYL